MPLASFSVSLFRGISSAGFAVKAPPASYSGSSGSMYSNFCWARFCIFSCLCIASGVVLSLKRPVDSSSNCCCLFEVLSPNRDLSCWLLRRLEAIDLPESSSPFSKVVLKLQLFETCSSTSFRFFCTLKGVLLKMDYGAGS